MPFPFGRAILAMILCSVLAGTALLFRRPAVHADLSLWTFADLHARMYQDRSAGPSLIDSFQAANGKSVQVDLIAAPALDVRLLSIFMFSLGKIPAVDSASPDLVELPLNSVGKYFRPPADEVGFLPLNTYLQSSGWMNRIVRSRFSPWSKSGIIFGVPHDLHPCTITYRKDLFDQAGVNLESARTWDQLQQSCLRFQEYWSQRDHPRWALGLSSSAADMLQVLLHQQHIDLVDSSLNVHLADPRVIKTLSWYAQAVAGPRRIGADLNPAAGQSSADLSAGDVCGLITPDWMVADLKQYSPDLAGKLHMMRLPKFNSEDASTASWGGTMIGITKSCQNPDLAWKLIESLYLDPQALRVRQKLSGIIPPVPEYWEDAVYHEPDPYYANQKIDELYIDLARELPDTQMTAYTVQAQIFLTIALNQVVAKARSSEEIGLEAFCASSLASAQAHLTAMIQFSR